MLADSFWLDFGSPHMLLAIEAALSRLPVRPCAVAVGLSGGADSAMLAVHAALFARQSGLKLHFFHVHHGLNPAADQWQNHVHDLAQALRIPCHSRRVQVQAASGDGIEAAARDARYAAFSELAALTGVSVLMLAHHKDDQAETVLLRLLRGAGPTGLAAMAPSMQRQGLTYLRPWLDVARADVLEQADVFFRLCGWEPVSDPSNTHDKYTRSAVRERLTPELNQRWPGWQGVLARHARLSAESSEILNEVAEQDFSGLDPSSDARNFSLQAWRDLSAARQALVLRYWLDRLGLRMPTDARLQDILRQLRGLHALGHDRQMSVKHGQSYIRCAKGRVFLDGPTPDQNDIIEKR